MIDARNAYRKSIINSKAKSYIDELEKAINKAISSGAFSATISISMVASEQNYLKSDNLSIKNAVVEELVSLGYKVEFVYAKPMPLGCPSDQWDFNNGHITVWWEEDNE